jgi:2-polyprenyl-3-methyl-5-hydroxy-6-metoxy-1,4-benzoquinol methylase
MAEYVPDAERHNHTIDYFRELLAAVPRRAVTALDIGCGEGFAARALAARGLAVSAVDIDEHSLELARSQDSTGIAYRRADVLADDIGGPFDVVTALAVMHHLPLEAGLERVKALVAPGGVLLVVGCAASTLPRDSGRELAAIIAHQAGRVTHRTWEQPSPTVWPPPVTYDEVSTAAARILPGSEFRRRLLWRYTLTWANG